MTLLIDTHAAASLADKHLLMLLSPINFLIPGPTKTPSLFFRYEINRILARSSVRSISFTQYYQHQQSQKPDLMAGNGQRHVSSY